MTTLSLRARLTLWYTLALLVVLCLFRRRRAVAAASESGSAASIASSRRWRRRSATSCRTSSTSRTISRRPRPRLTTTITAPGRALAILDTGGAVLGARLERPRAARSVDRRRRRRAGRSGPPDGAGAWRVHAQPHAFERRSVVAARRKPARRRGARAARGAGGDARRHADRAAAGGRRRPVARVDRTASDHRHGAARGAAFRRPASRIWDARIGPTSSASWRRRSTGWSRGFARRCRRSGSSWPTRRTSCGRRSSVVRATADVMLEPRASRRGRVPRSDGDRRRRRRGGWDAWSKTCWCWRAPTPAAIRCGRSISISTRSSPNAGAPSTCSRPSAASPSARPAPAEIPFRGDEDLLRRLVSNVCRTPSSTRRRADRSRWTVTRDAGRRPDPRDRRGPRHSRRRSAADLRSLRAARRGAPRQGTGLGLPIARWIAEAHGGTLVLERSGPGGTTFCVSLPVLS